MLKGASMVIVAGLLGVPVVHQGWVAQSTIKHSLDSLNADYADVPSSVNCAQPHNVAESLICKSPYLRQAELLNTRSQAYAIENATKRPLSHRNFKAKLPESCTSEGCIYDFFKSQTGDALGGESPYVAH